MQFDPDLFPVLVVGGAPDLVLGNLRRKLNGKGLEVAAHHTAGALKVIPAHCQCVVIVKDMCGHDLFEKATKLAKAANLPCAVGIRKWSSLWPRVQAAFTSAGVALPEPPAAVPVAEEVAPTVLSKEQLVEYATVLLHEDPERGLAHAALRQALLDNLDDDETPGPAIVDSAVGTAAAQAFKRWSGRKDAAAREELQALKHQWLVRWFMRADKAPTVRQIQDRCKKVFGVSYHGGLIKDARAEADSLSAEAEEANMVVLTTIADIEISVLDGPADPEQYVRMKDLWNLCHEMSTDVPKQVLEFFNNDEPRDGDGTRVLGNMHICASPESPFTEALVDLSQFPNATHIRVRFAEERLAGGLQAD